jgi:regulator of replication initiation timing
MTQLVVFLMCGLAAWAQVALPTEAQRWGQSLRLWKAVEKHRPESLPLDTQPDVARDQIEAAEKARIAYLRNQRALFCAQAAKLSEQADRWLAAAAQIEVADPADTLADLDERVAAIEDSLKALSQREDSAALTEAGRLRKQLADFRKLRKLLRDSPGKNGQQAYQQDALEIAQGFERMSSDFREMVEDLVLEEARWREHHNHLRHRFGLPVLPSSANAREGRSACVEVLLR